MVLAHCVRTDVYLSGLLPIDVFLLSYPSPNFIAFCPQPKAIFIIRFTAGQAREITFHLHLNRLSIILIDAMLY
jgi:hypothetical protein